MASALRCSPRKGALLAPMWLSDPDHEPAFPDAQSTALWKLAVGTSEHGFTNVVGVGVNPALLPMLDSLPPGAHDRGGNTFPTANGRGG